MRLTKKKDEKQRKITLLTQWRVHGVRTKTLAVAMERGVDGGGGARHWRRRGDWVTALEASEAARVCSLEFGFGFWRNSSLELWIWGNGLDFIECEIVRVWEGLREQVKNRESETEEMKTEEMRKSEKGRRRREWEAMSMTWRSWTLSLKWKLKSEDWRE